MLVTRSHVALSLVAFALVACSAAPPDQTLQGEVNPTNGSRSGTNKTGNKTTNKGGTTTTQDPADPAAPEDPAAPGTPATPGTPAPTNGQCSAQASAAACFQCCDTAFPGGMDVDAAAFGQCACETPGVCAQACGTSFCAGQQPTAACEQCLAGATACNTAAETACNANASCMGAFACIDSSGCDAKQ